MKMKYILKKYSKISITALMAIAALILGKALWLHYMNAPWTRDGRVRADVVNIAPDVDGLVVEVAVQDNQFVHKGDILFRIDPEHYQNALAQAEAVVDERKADLDMKLAQAARRAMVDDRVVSNEVREDAKLGAAAAKAHYLDALAHRDQARLNLERTRVRSPVDGWVSNLLVRPGDYSHAGTAELAVIDQKSFWIYGYFEENKIGLIKINDPVQVTLLGSDQKLAGHVESIAHGIADRDNPTGSRLLANVNPSFNWVRLEQRVPVRIKLDGIPKGVNLVAGMTCTVVVH